MLNYSDKKLIFKFGNEQGFDVSGNTSLTITDVKATVTTGGFGNTGGITADVTLTGLSLDIMSMLSSKGNGIFAQVNPRIYLDIIAEETTIFSGAIFASYCNMNSLPEPSLIINAITAFKARTDSTPPLSIKGTTTLFTIFSTIAKQQGWGINIPSSISEITITNPHYTGTTNNRLITICSDYTLQFSINNNTLNVWDNNTVIDNLIPYVSPDTGLVGYPIFSQSGISFQTTFSPLLQGGRQVKLVTSLPNASGVYRLYQVEHVLSSWIPKGPWHSLCQALRTGAYA